MSTVIVLAVAVGVAAWVNRDLIRIKIASVYARVAPKAGEPQGRFGVASAPLTGDAPWALSALPECLTQIAEAHGPQAYVAAHVPSGVAPIAPPAQLTYGNCTIALQDDEAFVRRGVDRLRIPPKVRFYRAGGLLVVIRQAAGSFDMRVYQPVTP